MTQRSAAIGAAAKSFEDGSFQKDLTALVAVQTSSREEERRPDLMRYLETEMRKRFEAMGFAVDIHPNEMLDRAPFLVARRIEDPSLPTLFCYGHGDTVPGEEGRWSEDRDPWTLDVAQTPSGPRWYGRGTADNKAQHAINMEAMRHVIDTRGRLGYNATFLIEMAEEMGSPGLYEFCRDNRDMLAADLLIASDGPRFSTDAPDIKLGTRGGLNLRFRLEYREGGHHSGNWGGLLANPAIVLMHALTTLVSRTGEILHSGLKPAHIKNSVRDALAKVTVTSGPDDPEIDPWWGEPGLSGAEKVFGWNTFEVLSFIAGDPEKPQNAVPPFAEAICQIRFVVDTDPDTFLPLIRQHLKDQGFDGITVEPARMSMLRASRLDPEHSAVGWAVTSIEKTTGKPVTVIPNAGGSLPNDIFLNTIGMPTLWVPHSYAGCSQHAPNEHVLPHLMKEGLEMMTGLFWDLGDGFP
ncbi:MULTISPECIES: M20 family metallopeptidase [unclassified Roseibium]|uniref:M20 family metallopeptidase n=1 Tax=unclassified Roseibium TaxID=2629323 RepID=UPI00273EC679|nr:MULTISPECIES: M20 family metallopeptidase [unclassified Roseibium]